MVKSTLKHGNLGLNWTFIHTEHETCNYMTCCALWAVGKNRGQVKWQFVSEVLEIWNSKNCFLWYLDQILMDLSWWYSFVKVLPSPLNLAIETKNQLRYKVVKGNVSKNWCLAFFRLPWGNLNCIITIKACLILGMPSVIDSSSSSGSPRVPLRTLRAPLVNFPLLEFSSTLQGTSGCLFGNI